MAPVRYLLVLPGVVMVAFAAVQYNDPDALVWIAIYLVPAAWAFAAAFRPAQVCSLAGERLLWASVAIGAALTVFYWPTMPNFWVKDVWWVEETAREGMGMMIAFAVLLAVLATTLLRKRAA